MVPKQSCHIQRQEEEENAVRSPSCLRGNGWSLIARLISLSIPQMRMHVPISLQIDIFVSFIMFPPHTNGNLYVWTHTFHFIVSEEVRMHTAF